MTSSSSASSASSSPSPSYLERALAWFLKTKVFGGVKTLREPQYKGFFYFGLVVVCGTTTLLVASMILPWIAGAFVQLVLQCELFGGFAFLLGGVLVGKTRSTVTYATTFALVGGAVGLAIWWAGAFAAPALQWTRLGLLLAWTLISALSSYFLLRSYFTSLASKVIALGNAKERIFLGPLVKLAAVVAIPVYAYLVFVDGGVVVGLAGLVYSGLFFGVVTRMGRKDPRASTLASMLGFYNFAVVYHLVFAFSTTSFTIPALLVDTALNVVLLLYIVQAWTRRFRKIDPAEADPLDDEMPAPTFKREVTYPARLKKAFGEKGLVLLAFGLVLAYHAVFLGYYLETTLPGLTWIAPTGLKLSAVYHRLFLLVAFGVVAASLVLYRRSEAYREFVTNRYTVLHAGRLLLQWFRRGPEGEKSPLEASLARFGADVKEKVQEWGRALKGKREEATSKGDRQGQEKDQDQGQDSPSEGQGEGGSPTGPPAREKGMSKTGEFFQELGDNLKEKAGEFFTGVVSNLKEKWDESRERGKDERGNATGRASGKKKGREP